MRAIKSWISRARRETTSTEHHGKNKKSHQDARHRVLSNYEKQRNIQVALSTMQELENMELQATHADEMQRLKEALGGYQSREVIVVFKVIGKQHEIEDLIHDDVFVNVELMVIKDDSILLHVQIEDYIHFRQHLKCHFCGLQIHILGSIYAGSKLWQ